MWKKVTALERRRGKPSSRRVSGATVEKVFAADQVTFGSIRMVSKDKEKRWPPSKQLPSLPLGSRLRVIISCQILPDANQSSSRSA